MKEQQTTVIYHRADYDGLFSAAVCAKFLPDGTEFIGWDYGDPLIEFPEGVVYIVDLSPDCLVDLPEVDVKRLIWIDHHKSSIEKWNAINEWIIGYRIDGVAACRLCWQWFKKQERGSEDIFCGNMPITSFPKLEEYNERRVEEPLALTLAGEYDVWDLSDRRSLPLQFGLTASGAQSFRDLAVLLERGGDSQTEELCVQGDTALAWQQAFAGQVMRERSYRRDWEGLRFAVIGSAHTRNSMWFPQAELEKEVQALMCWRYDGEKVMFSLYHAPGHEQHDLSVIAAKYGGGGHRGACGFTLPLAEAIQIIQ